MRVGGVRYGRTGWRAGQQLWQQETQAAAITQLHTRPCPDISLLGGEAASCTVVRWAAVTGRVAPALMR